jgi:uncharacterized lipoprotein YddW (UPF0748 family)
MRGIWVATVNNIDFHQHHDKNSFAKEYLEVVKNLCAKNLDTVIFQIRPTNDAFYKSELNPWSSFLCGKEGEGIGEFDPLQFMIEEAHKANLEFHAWLNPYRVIASTPLCKQDYLNTLDVKNFARKHPELVLEVALDDGNYQLILNPGEPKVLEFIFATVKEIVDNYNVDAIHFDDYFYPYGGIGDIDKECYAKYNSANLSIDDWRRLGVLFTDF